MQHGPTPRAGEKVDCSQDIRPRQLPDLEHFRLAQLRLAGFAMLCPGVSTFGQYCWFEQPNVRAALARWDPDPLDMIEMSLLSSCARLMLSATPRSRYSCRMGMYVAPH